MPSASPIGFATPLPLDQLRFVYQTPGAIIIGLLSMN